MIKNLIRFLRVGKRTKEAAMKRSSVPRRALRVMHQGEHHDLMKIYDQVNAQYFESKLDLAIKWVGNKASMPRTRVMFGSYNQQTKLIKIHRRLDQAHIPHHFVSYVIYHEMLHHVLPPTKEWRQKRKIHHPDFIEREKHFQEFALAKAFSDSMKKNWFKRGA